MTDRSSPLAKLFMVEPENDWRAEAACAGMDPAVFFSPEAFESKQERDEREDAVKAVCATCPVRQPCLEYAYAAGERYGIWGGLTEQERRSLARRSDGGQSSERVS